MMLIDEWMAGVIHVLYNIIDVHVSHVSLRPPIH
jgi:hypothetical protein